MDKVLPSYGLAVRGLLLVAAFIYSFPGYSDSDILLKADSYTSLLIDTSIWQQVISSTKISSYNSTVTDNRIHDGCVIAVNNGNLEEAIARADLSGMSCTISFSEDIYLSKTVYLNNHKLRGEVHAGNTAEEGMVSLISRYHIVPDERASLASTLYPANIIIWQNHHQVSGLPKITAGRNFNGNVLLEMSGSASLESLSLVMLPGFSANPMGIRLRNHMTESSTFLDVAWYIPPCLLMPMVATGTPRMVSGTGKSDGQQTSGNGSEANSVEPKRTSSSLVRALRYLCCCGSGGDDDEDEDEYWAYTDSKRKTGCNADRGQNIDLDNVDIAREGTMLRVGSAESGRVSSSESTESKLEEQLAQVRLRLTLMSSTGSLQQSSERLDTLNSEVRELQGRRFSQEHSQSCASPPCYPTSHPVSVPVASRYRRSVSTLDTEFQRLESIMETSQPDTQEN